MANNSSTLYPAALDSVEDNPSMPDRSDAAVLALEKQAGLDEVITGDGAITVSDGAGRTVVLTKGSAAAITLAAPNRNGQVIRVVSASNFAHVVTATGLIHDGTTGAHNTATFAAFAGASITLYGYVGKWYTVATIGQTIA
jgi:hypothetical protein